MRKLRRLLDGVEPELLERAEHAILHVDGGREVRDLRLRWVGHRLQGDATVVVGGRVDRRGTGSRRRPSARPSPTCTRSTACACG